MKIHIHSKITLMFFRICMSEAQWRCKKSMLKRTVVWPARIERRRSRATWLFFSTWTAAGAGAESMAIESGALLLAVLLLSDEVTEMAGTASGAGFGRNSRTFRRNSCVALSTKSKATCECCRGNIHAFAILRV